MIEESLKSITDCVRTGHGRVYVVIDFKDDSPWAVRCYVGSTSACFRAASEGLCSIITLNIQKGVDPKSILAQLIGIQCCPGINLAKSIPDAIGQVLEKAYQPGVLTNHENISIPANIHSTSGATTG